MKADFGQLNWTGRTWRLEHNNKKLPSMKQIRDGLVKESKVQIKNVMGDAEDQQNIIDAQNESEKTWTELMNIVQMEDENEPLKAGVHYENDDDPGTPFGLNDPDHPMVAMITYIYQQESFVYKELNNSSRKMDESKIHTLGPFASALFKIITGTQKNRKEFLRPDDNKPIGKKFK